MLMTLKKPNAQLAVETFLSALEQRLSQSPFGDCPVRAALSFVALCKSQSCGKCTPCRIGLWQLSRLLEDIASGKGDETRLELLTRTARTVYETADCAVGWEAGRVVLRSVETFPDDFKNHARGGSCLPDPGAPCVTGCPAHVDIPGYLALTQAGRYDDAVRLIRASNPFPTVCAFICEHPCEARCRRVILDAPVSIRAVKRYAVDHAAAGGRVVPVPRRAPATGKRVAVVGGGPAGLTAAYFLALMGHEAAVYEKRAHLGGMLRYGIPSYRLPRDRLQWDLDAILSAGGITLAQEIDIGSEIWIESLRGSYDAVFIAIGAHAEKRLGIPGEDLRGVISAVEMLRLLGSGAEDQLPAFAGKRVVVVGGGNVAMDAGRSALRLGAAAVSIVYRRRREDMTALPEEVDEAMAEGCALMTLRAPLRVEAAGDGGDGDAGGAAGVDAVALWVERQIPGPIEGGRPRPVKADQDPERIPCDLVIVAIGQDIDSARLSLGGVKTKRGLIVVSREGAVEGLPGVFAGGDCVTGPATVIRAIETGRVAAYQIDRYLGYSHRLESGVETLVPPPAARDMRQWGRVTSEVMTGEELCQEAGRCLRCDKSGMGSFTYHAVRDGGRKA